MSNSKLAAMKMTLAGVALATTALATVACTSPAEAPAPVSETVSETTTPAAPEGNLQEQKMWEREHQLRTGETVTCLYVADTGLSCDWAGVSEPEGGFK